MSADQWKPGVIAIKSEYGDLCLPGWLDHPFGLDWGIHKDTGETMWVVHHLPSGWNIAAVNHEIAEAMRFVTLMRSLGDWNFTDPNDPANMANLRDAVAVARAEGFDICSPRRVGRPTYPDMLDKVS